jgi:hypothetical protein
MIRIRPLFLLALPTLLLPAKISFAQTASEGSEGIIRQINSIDPGTLSVLMIFGTGLVASLCWGIGWIISCSRQNRVDAESVRDEVAALEARVAAIEQALGSPVGASLDQPGSN